MPSTPYLFRSALPRLRQLLPLRHLPPMTPMMTLPRVTKSSASAPVAPSPTRPAAVPPRTFPISAPTTYVPVLLVETSRIGRYASVRRDRAFMIWPVALPMRLPTGSSCAPARTVPSRSLPAAVPPIICRPPAVSSGRADVPRPIAAQGSFAIVRPTNASRIAWAAWRKPICPRPWRVETNRLVRQLLRFLLLFLPSLQAQLSLQQSLQQHQLRAATSVSMSLLPTTRG
mmetsp:Transcript_24700/g.54613  ORF Transcript_24700/g.54613 Transcript_24700/m.54613 type:complete len:229 (-) Transcript_24700:777-1463(-)